MKLLRLIRAIWRYRKQLDEHRRAYLVELATILHSEITAKTSGRVLLTTYRILMWILAALSIGLILLAAAVVLSLRHHDWWMLTGLVFAVPGVWIGLQWLTWGMALRWLDEFADKSRTVSRAELPGRLRELAKETRGIANVPRRLSEELEALSRDSASTQNDSGISNTNSS